MFFFTWSRSRIKIPGAGAAPKQAGSKTLHDALTIQCPCVLKLGRYLFSLGGPRRISLLQALRRLSLDSLAPIWYCIRSKITTEFVLPWRSPVESLQLGMLQYMYTTKWIILAFGINYTVYCIHTVHCTVGCSDLVLFSILPYGRLSWMRFTCSETIKKKKKKFAHTPRHFQIAQSDWELKNKSWIRKFGKHLHKGPKNTRQNENSKFEVYFLSNKPWKMGIFKGASPHGKN